jgi:isopenicillin-N N-acyltransferase-like protein
VRGHAKGAGLSFEQAFALRCAVELIFYFQPAGAALCTSFATSGDATASGATMLGQNIDWFSGTPIALLRQEYPDGLRQLTLCLVGVSEYTLTSNGLGICINGTVAAWTPPGPGIPLLCYLPRVMRQKNLGQARQLLESAARGVGYCQLADASGEIFGIESDFSNQCILEPEDGVMVHSNHYLSEQFQEKDGARDIFPDSYERLPRIKKLMTQYRGNLTPKRMMKVLGDHKGSPNSICRHPDLQAPPHMRSETLASYIMEPANGVMHLAVGNPCHNHYEEFCI